MIPFAEALLPATFLLRENRFRATVLLDGQPVAARIANPGRLTELCVPGYPCYVSPANGPGRKTCFDLRLVAYAGTLISLDTQLPNALFEEALAAGMVDFPGYAPGSFVWRREVGLGSSRIDFLLTQQNGSRCWVETKSVTLVEGGVALFPDAPTIRGRRHLDELASAVSAGDCAVLSFVIQRDDARAVAPHRTADPDFAAALRRAFASGVLLRAYTCRVSLDGVEILREIPVIGVER